MCAFHTVVTGMAGNLASPCRRLMSGLSRNVTALKAAVTHRYEVDKFTVQAMVIVGGMEISMNYKTASQARPSWPTICNRRPYIQPVLNPGEQR